MQTIDTAGLFSRYPHLAKKISMTWGTQECREILVSLMSDSRSSVRTGFSHEDAKTIFMLLDRHDALYPQFDKEPEIAAPARPAVAARQAMTKQSEGNGLMRYIYPFLALIGFAATFKAYKIFF